MVTDNDFLNNIEVQNITTLFNLGDKVSVCLEKKVSFTGEIVELKEDNYIVRPDENTLPDSNVKLLKLNRSDENVEISKSSHITTAKCYGESKELLTAYLYNDVSEPLKDNLNLIVPNTREILENNDLTNFRSINELNNLLYNYDLTVDDLTVQDFNVIKKILNKNNNLRKPNTNLKKWMTILML